MVTSTNVWVKFPEFSPWETPQKWCTHEEKEKTQKTTKKFNEEAILSYSPLVLKP